MSSCKDLSCRPSPCYPDICPDPCVVARNEPCITSCADSTAVVYPPPVSVLFPGPILSSSPQHSLVGSTLPALPYGARGSFGGGALGGLPMALGKHMVMKGQGTGGGLGGQGGGKWEGQGRG
uniref:Keratin n=1 Tax=Chrysemys picta bellii TaxID=8478 RepID=A0A8C3INB1_CHRPI